MKKVNTNLFGRIIKQSFKGLALRDLTLMFFLLLFVTASAQFKPPPPGGGGKGIPGEGEEECFPIKAFYAMDNGAGAPDCGSSVGGFYGNPIALSTIPMMALGGQPLWDDRCSGFAPDGWYSHDEVDWYQCKMGKLASISTTCPSSASISLSTVNLTCPTTCAGSTGSSTSYIITYSGLGSGALMTVEGHANYQLSTSSSTWSTEEEE